MNNNSDMAHLVINLFSDDAGSIEVSLTAVGGSRESLLVNAAAQICEPAVKAFADAMFHNHTRCTASTDAPLIKTNVARRFERAWE